MLFRSTQGTQGLQGTQGTQGLQGTQGTQGLQGTQGTQGLQGTQGTQGLQGTQGTQGLQGTQGTQGIIGPVAGSNTQVIYNNNGSSAGATNFVYISSNQNVGIGTTNPTQKLHVEGNGYFVGIITCTDVNTSSDFNLKYNIHKVENALDKILQLDGVSFTWKEDNRPSIGVIAQEVEKILPELVSSSDPKTVNYNGFVGVFVECIKELKNEIVEIKKQVEELKGVN